MLCMQVERAKKCLDYGATCYIWHCMFVWWYSASWPASAAWWIANLVGFAVMVLLGEWFCVRREMQDIPLSLHKWGSRKASGSVMQPIPTEDPDQLPPKPRLRPNTMLRPAAAVAAAAAAGGGGSPLSAGASGAGLQLPAPGGTRPPSLLQMATLNSSSNARDSVAGRKKMVSRPGSAVNLAAGQRPMPAADVDGS
ncbi:integral membrane protein S linking to the trans Golgi network-domain-containing protein [Scenedesmus sp. NREL 46B-D3]|nr:integral membrane protein S linking to the trans Golgi network-domain-containing protein [Scenedesmus sp. NREL 46B-D3]